MNIELKHSTLTCPIVADPNSKRSNLAKRGLTGGIKYDLSQIPNNTLEALLIAAVEDFIRVPLKGDFAANCTVEEAQAKMNERLELLKAGKLAGVSGTRKPPTVDPVVKLAKQLVKNSLMEAATEELDKTALNKVVNDFFTSAKAFAKYPAEHKFWTAEDDEGNLKNEREAAEAASILVEDAMIEARAAIAKQEKLTKMLGNVATNIKRAEPKEASATKKAAPQKRGSPTAAREAEVVASKSTKKGKSA